MTNRDRYVPLAGTSNFRDLGGYEGHEGRRVKWGHLYRSDSLANLTEEDLSRVERLGIRVICDFRREEERDDAPNRIPDNKPEMVHLNIGPKRSDSRLYEYLSSSIATVDDIRGAMIHIYRSFVTEFQPHYTEFMKRLALTDHLPLLFHCAVGKDRTGFGAAIVLSALHVPHEVILEDYLLTNRYLNRDVGDKFPGLSSPELFHTMLSASPEYLQAAFDVIDQQYGGIDGYLEDALGVDESHRQMLRDNLLD